MTTYERNIYASASIVKAFGQWVNVFMAMRFQVQRHGMKGYTSDLMRHDRAALKVLQDRNRLGRPFIWILGSHGTFLLHDHKLVNQALEAVDTEGTGHVYYWTGDRLIEKTADDAAYALQSFNEEWERDTKLLSASVLMDTHILRFNTKAIDTKPFAS